MPERIAVVGVASSPAALCDKARDALSRARLVVGGHRQLEALGASGDQQLVNTELLVLDKDVAGALDRIAEFEGPVCVVASGDPGFFGILRQLRARFGPEQLEVHPAASSVAAAFARLALPWDDAVVVSAHGRPLEAAAAAAARSEKVAVLVSPQSPPEALGRALVALGAGGARRVSVCSNLGTTRESVSHTDLEGLAAGTWDPVSVVVLEAPAAADRGAPIVWGLDESRFEHRDGMVTKAEVRAVALGKLELAPTGVMWDVGAASASVAIEAARLAPALRVVAVERDETQVLRAVRNAEAHGVEVEVLHGEAPAALGTLPDPDRVFVGGGGLEVLDAVLARLRPSGRVVATYSALDRAAEAARRLGELVQVSVARGERLPDGGLRLDAANPVFVVWGPSR